MLGYYGELTGVWSDGEEANVVGPASRKIHAVRIVTAYFIEAPLLHPT